MAVDCEYSSLKICSDQEKNLRLRSLSHSLTPYPNKNYRRKWTISANTAAMCNASVASVMPSNIQSGVANAGMCLSLQMDFADVSYVLPFTLT